MKKWIVFGLMSLLAIGCMRARPYWAQKDSNVFLGKEVFYGVGTVSGVKNKPLGQMVADNKARSEIAGILEAFAEALALDYAASMSEADFKRENEKQNVALVLKTYAATSASDLTVVDTWTDPSDGTFYSFVKFKLKKFKNEIAEAKEIGPHLKKFVKKNAKNTFNRFKSNYASRKKS